MQTSRERNCRFERRLATYGLAGAAALAVPQAASAGPILYSGPLNQSVTGTAEGAQYVFDFDGNSAVDFTIEARLSPLPAISLLTPGGNAFVPDAIPFSGKPAALGEGTLIGPSNATGTSSSELLNGYESVSDGPAQKGNFQGTNYLGVRFATAPGSDRYGWIHLTTDVSNDDPSYANFTVVDWAYDTAGDPIAAGSVESTTPEPSSVALFALGAAGILALMKRRKKA